MDVRRSEWARDGLAERGKRSDIRIALRGSARRAVHRGLTGVLWVWAVVVALPAYAGKPPVPPTVDASWRVRYVSVYPECGGARHEGEGGVPIGLRDLDAAAVARALAPATVAFGPGVLSITRTLPGCPTATVTLSTQAGVVVVLAGPPGDNPEVLRRTGIRVRGLSAEDAARIATGWGVPAAALGDTLARLAAESGSTTTSSPAGGRA